MVVNGFKLPAAFVQLVEAMERGEAPENWRQKEKVDAYGHPWRTFGLEIYTDPDWMAEESRELDRMFREEERFAQYEEERGQPGFVEDFTDVSNYVRFATNGVGEMFCFDFGSDPEAPTVVSWPSLDCYWRRVAPNFETFIALFHDRNEAPLPQDEGEFEVVQPTSRRLLEIGVASYAMAPPELQPSTELPTEAYASCSTEERREVEASIREYLEGMGMTDEQRRRLDEVWERLRALWGR